MIWFVWNIMLALVWLTLTGNFSAPGMLAGFIFGYMVLWLVAAGTGRRMGYIQKIPQIISFTCYYIWELLKSNMRVAYEVLTPTHSMKPGVIGLPLDAQSDAAITIFANLVTFTPGTLSLDVSNDRRMLFIHAMYIDDEEQLVADLKHMERRVIKLLS
ncbi:multicomponent Na+:H+ antiporter subunit E [Natronocella acetinitrilica]|jgi:multicomponent Na+:H+ antiporter subunit E|uniref:Multicomponent Na+:H+ antiporter subunit E n=1 Tax=Natronocella acetinitrilica TaxID=414046 RepID=A0AAE3G7W2_9GAMM|nr:Na+/H+ antiporter subunit E [Natronocella acetinitrilica]MCP1676664.1 multicomponent Na+:H+ antiporter subunit E [Natronocella acetinitrilica]